MLVWAFSAILNRINACCIRENILGSTFDFGTAWLFYKLTREDICHAAQIAFCTLCSYQSWINIYQMAHNVSNVLMLFTEKNFSSFWIQLQLCQHLVSGFRFSVWFDLYSSLCNFNSKTKNILLLFSGAHQERRTCLSGAESPGCPVLKQSFPLANCLTWYWAEI